jgi:hypothetical protein
VHAQQHSQQHSSDPEICFPKIIGPKGLDTFGAVGQRIVHIDDSGFNASAEDEEKIREFLKIQNPVIPSLQKRVNSIEEQKFTDYISSGDKKNSGLQVLSEILYLATHAVGLSWRKLSSKLDTSIEKYLTSEEISFLNTLSEEVWRSSKKEYFKISDPHRKTGPDEVSDIGFLLSESIKNVPEIFIENVREFVKNVGSPQSIFQEVKKEKYKVRNRNQGLSLNF